MRKLRLVALLCVAALIVVEVSVRVLGLASVPLRSADAIIGYLPVPSQHGRFLRNDWTINKLSMISTAEYRDTGDELLLVGDSIVFGGNPLAQRERVGEQLDGLLAQPVFAIADGSWGLKNELRYLLTRRQVTRPNRIVFLLNSADFAAPSSWRCESTHPRSRPLSHAFFAYRKYFDLDCEAHTPSALVVSDFDANAALNELARTMPAASIGIFLYPTRDEFAARTSLAGLVADFDQVANGRIEVGELLDYASDVSWHDGLYLDAIHPSAEGAAALASALAMFITQTP